MHNSKSEPEGPQDLSAAEIEVATRLLRAYTGGNVHSMFERLLAEVKRHRAHLSGAALLVADLRETLDRVKAALGDRLLGKGPLSKEYAHGIMREIDAALGQSAEAAKPSADAAPLDALRGVLNDMDVALCAHGQTHVPVKTISDWIEHARQRVSALAVAPRDRNDIQKDMQAAEFWAFSAVLSVAGEVYRQCQDNQLYVEGAGAAHTALKFLSELRAKYGPAHPNLAKLPSRGQTPAAALRDERQESLQREKDSAYRERNQCVALILRMALALDWRAGVGQHEDKPGESWEADWRTLVSVDLPTGQASWHFHDSERHLLAGLPAYTAPWDGHTTAEKYRRVAAAAPLGAPVARQDEVTEMLKALRSELEYASGFSSDADFNGRLLPLVDRANKLIGDLEPSPEKQSLAPAASPITCLHVICDEQDTAPEVSEEQRCELPYCAICTAGHCSDVWHTAATREHERAEGLINILIGVADALGLGGDQFFAGPVPPESILDFVKAEVEDTKTAEARAEVLAKELVALRTPRMFPLQLQLRSEKYDKQQFREIPWPIAERAYSTYAVRYGKDQSLERLAQRGGFDQREMDEFYPAWRDELAFPAQLAAATARVAELEKQLAEKEREEIASRHATREAVNAAQIRAETAESALAKIRSQPLYVAGRVFERQEIARLADVADKSTHPADLAAAIRALPAPSAAPTGAEEQDALIQACLSRAAAERRRQATLEMPQDTKRQRYDHIVAYREALADIVAAEKGTLALALALLDKSAAPLPSAQQILAPVVAPLAAPEKP